jgi:Galactosyltransferase
MLFAGDPSSHPYLVLFIPSRPDYAEERAAVRETWGMHARLCNVRVVFGFGTFQSEEIFHEARIENGLYGDLLQTSNVIDAYHNQTRLVLSFFEWGAEHCQGSRFIGKADEDTWINIFGILKYLQLPEAGQVIKHLLDCRLRNKRKFVYAAISLTCICTVRLNYNSNAHL